MRINMHTSLATVDEKIDYYIAQNDDEPYEDGPYALRQLYEFIVDGVANGHFAFPAAICDHVQTRLREYREA